MYIDVTGSITFYRSSAGRVYDQQAHCRNNTFQSHVNSVMHSSKVIKSMFTFHNKICSFDIQDNEIDFVISYIIYEIAIINRRVIQFFCSVIKNEAMLSM